MPETVTIPQTDEAISQHSQATAEVTGGFDGVQTLAAGAAESTNTGELVFDGSVATLMGVSAYFFTRHLLNDRDTTKRDREFTRRVIPSDYRDKTTVTRGEPTPDKDRSSPDSVASTEAEAKRRRRNDAIAGAVGALAAGVGWHMTHGN